MDLYIDSRRRRWCRTDGDFRGARKGLLSGYNGICFGFFRV